MALKLNAAASATPALAAAGVEVMASDKVAPATGVMRNADGGARRVRKGSPIPDGWTFDGGEDAAPKPKAAKGGKKPAENTKAEGPSEQG